MMKVVICICTCRRPRMLKCCLDSIARQDVPDVWDVSVILVDNDPQSELSNDLPKITASYPFHIRYQVESSRGIPFARNTACELALDSGADWIIFIDDDEEAEPGWLLAYAKALGKFDAKVFSGPVRYILPEGACDLRTTGKQFLADGLPLEKAATNNVMFSTDLLKPPLSMRFDINMALTGGSDLEFFMRYRRACGKMRTVSGAIVSEVVLENRQTLGWRLKRNYRSAANLSYIHVKHLGRYPALYKVLVTVFTAIPLGCLRLLTAPILIFRGYSQFGRALYRGLRYWVRSAGALAGFIGAHPAPYRNTDGY